MESAKIGVELDNGKMMGFNINSEIREGLYLTLDKDLIEENIKNFNIDIEVIPNQVATKFSKKDKVVIISIIVNEDRKYQYLVSADLDIEKIEKMDSKEMPEQIKGLIREAYSITQANRHSDSM